MAECTELCTKALQALEDMESTVPCDMMSGYEYCEEHCKHEYNGAVNECWKYFLTEWEE